MALVMTLKSINQKPQFDPNMNISKINLNLLIALDSLLTECNVTRAREKIFITQSAMSNVLKQLREIFQDELLVMTVFAKGGRAYLHQEATRQVLFSKATTVSGTKIAPEIALGFGYRFTPKTELDLTISRTFAGEPYLQNHNPIISTNTVLLGLAYDF